MIKRLLIITALGMGLLACNNPKQEEATAVSTTEFTTVAENLVDQTVTMEGTVMHVCKHGGKKMFINEDRIKVIASEKLAAFDTEWEGSTMVITGIVREEAIPVLTDDQKMTNHEAPAADQENQEGTETAAADCDFEDEKKLYVVEVIQVTEKVQ